MATTFVQSIKEVSRKLEDGETLCLQLAMYNYEEGSSDIRFRFIRKDKDGRMKAQRGQAGIPNLNLILELAEEMKSIITDEVSTLQKMVR